MPRTGHDLTRTDCQKMQQIFLQSVACSLHVAGLFQICHLHSHTDMSWSLGRMAPLMLDVLACFSHASTLIFWRYAAQAQNWLTSYSHVIDCM